MSKNIYEMHFPSNLENKDLCSVYSEGISLAVGLMRVQISITGMTHIYDGMSERQLRTNSTEYLQNWSYVHMFYFFCFGHGGRS